MNLVIQDAIIKINSVVSEKNIKYIPHDTLNNMEQALSHIKGNAAGWGYVIVISLAAILMLIMFISSLLAKNFREATSAAALLVLFTILSVWFFDHQNKIDDANKEFDNIVATGMKKEIIPQTRKLIAEAKNVSIDKIKYKGAETNSNYEFLYDKTFIACHAEEKDRHFDKNKLTIDMVVNCENENGARSGGDGPHVVMPHPVIL